MIAIRYKGKFGGVFRGVVALLLGIVMLFIGNAVNVIIYIIAAFMLVSGLLSLYGGLKKEKDTWPGIVLINSGFNVLIAALMFLFANELSNFIVGLIGFIMVFLGFIQLLVLGFAVYGGQVSKGFIAMPIVVLSCGALLLFKPAFVGEFIGALIGVTFIIYGLSELVASWKIKDAENDGHHSPLSEDGIEAKDDVKDVDYEKVDEQ